MAASSRHLSRKDSVVSTPPSFAYEPLDYTRGAIRLLRFLPHLSQTGLLQCEVWHASIESTYNCLSYVWGPEDDQQEILINGRAIRVRKNLRDFMKVARKKYAASARAFWIDAICIDQTSTKERNHQVAQMGSIYSSAVEVVSWLGHSEALRSAFAFASEATKLNSRKFDFWDFWDLWNQHRTDTNGHLHDNWMEVVHNQYWKRAWITQEIVLARRLVLLVGQTETNPMDLRVMWRAFGRLNEEGKNLREEQWGFDIRVFATYVRTMAGQLQIRGQNLARICNGFPSRQSQRPRDRIYSLLSIASDAALIPVDYDSSDTEVFLHVIKALQKSLCVCFWLYLVDALEYKADFPAKNSPGSNMPILELPIQAAETEFYSGPDLDDWTTICSTCQTKLPNAETRAYLFCIQKLCPCCPGGAHFYLRRYHTKTGTARYTVQRAFEREKNPEIDVPLLRVDGAPSEHSMFDFDTLNIDDTGDDGRDFSPVFRISLPADVLVHLLKDNPHYKRTRGPLQLCRKATEDKGGLVYYESLPPPRAESQPVQSAKAAYRGGLTSLRRMLS